MGKAVAKSRKKSRPGKNGGLLNTGGNEGNVYGAGRPPDKFLAALREARDRPSVQQFLRACLDGKHGAQAALKALEFTTERVDGKVAQPHKVDADVKVTVEVVSEVG